MKKRFSTITLRETGEKKKVQITSDSKPVIRKELIDKWQALIDTAARIVNVPSGLIMRLNEENIEVFLKSETEGNPYKKGEKADLVYGLYCETVIGKQEKLIVADATKNAVWKDNNPDVGINMISYLGFPINWPDGEVFGTVCLLDNKENHYNKNYENLLFHIKKHIESDLNLSVLNSNLKHRNTELEHLNNTKSRFLSLISHDIRGNIATIDEFLKLIIKDYDNLDKERIKTLLSSLSQNASTSYETLENLLRWSKNDVVQLEPDLAQVDIIATIERVLHYYKQSIELKSISIKKHYSEARAFVYSDENMLTVIFRNIISNAIKYNRKRGSIHISVDKTDDKHIVEIKDTGIGIEKINLENLFMYREEEKTGTGGESSAGIGLMITKEFLDKLDAQIEVESKRHEGTTIKIML